MCGNGYKLKVSFLHIKEEKGQKNGVVWKFFSLQLWCFCSVGHCPWNMSAPPLRCGDAAKVRFIQFIYSTQETLSFPPAKSLKKKKAHLKYQSMPVDFETFVKDGSISQLEFTANNFKTGTRKRKLECPLRFLRLIHLSTVFLYTPPFSHTHYSTGARNEIVRARSNINKNCIK